MAINFSGPPIPGHRQALAAALMGQPIKSAQFDPTWANNAAKSAASGFKLGYGDGPNKPKQPGAPLSLAPPNPGPSAPLNIDPQAQAWPQQQGNGMGYLGADPQMQPGQLPDDPQRLAELPWWMQAT